jgi:hypothetical protein
MKNMDAFLRVVTMVMMVGGAAALPGQSNPALAVPVAAPTPPPTVAPATDPVAVADADKPTHYGMRHADFVALNEAMMRAAQDNAEIEAIDAKVEALLAQREALLINAALRQNPALAEKFQVMQTNTADLKRKQAAQKEQAKAFKKNNPLAGTPAAVPQN